MYQFLTLCVPVPHSVCTSSSLSVYQFLTLCVPVPHSVCTSSSLSVYQFLTLCVPVPHSLCTSSSLCVYQFLTLCVYCVVFFCRKLVFPGDSASVECTLYPSEPGQFTLLASLCCDQLTDIRGHAQVTVRP